MPVGLGQLTRLAALIRSCSGLGQGPSRTLMVVLNRVVQRCGSAVPSLRIEIGLRRSPDKANDIGVPESRRDRRSRSTTGMGSIAAGPEMGQERSKLPVSFQTGLLVSPTSAIGDESRRREQFANRPKLGRQWKDR